MRESMFVSSPEPTRRPAIDAALVGACQAGDTVALRRLFDTIVGDVHHIIARLLGAHPELDDTCQEALLAVYAALPRFAFRSEFRTWLYSICVRTAWRHMRRWRRRLEAPPDADPADTGPDPERRAAMREEVRILERTLGRMAPKKRTAYLLAEVEGLSIEEVAQIVGTSVATVHTRLHYARRELRKALERRGGGES
jgi:RNA polymerase sigma-70 factor, ECF subfamily